MLYEVITGVQTVDELQLIRPEPGHDVLLWPLGRLEEARCWLRKAFALGNTKELIKKARTDTDLETLWPEISGLK